jgi:hypothetical protein
LKLSPDRRKASLSLFVSDLAFRLSTTAASPILVRDNRDRQASWTIWLIFHLPHNYPVVAERTRFAASQKSCEVFTMEPINRGARISIASAEQCGVGPAGIGESVMQQRRRVKQTQSLEERLAQEANRLREEAKLLPPGGEREALLRKARQAETGSHMSEWLTSPGLRPPE